MPSPTFGQSSIANGVDHGKLTWNDYATVGTRCPLSMFMKNCRMASTAGRYSLLLELESAMKSRDAQARATVLERVADLIFGARGNADQIALFDDVFSQLVQQIDASARAKLASDGLATHGNPDVLGGLSANPDTQFLDVRFADLLTQGAKDGQIAENLAKRSDVPPRIYHQLLTEATDAVRAQLLNNAHPEHHQIITRAMEKVCREFNQALRPEISAAARRAVYEAYVNDELNEDVLAEFARTNMFAEAVVSLAVLTSTPVGVIEHQMVNGRISGLLVLCRSKNYKWRTAKVVICVGHKRSDSDLEQARYEYTTLSVQSAARALRFVCARQALTSEGQNRPIKPAMKVLLMGLDRRSGQDRRSGMDTRSDEEKRLQREGRSGLDRRSNTATHVFLTTTDARKR
jgi:hypothetical protein